VSHQHDQMLAIADKAIQLAKSIDGVASVE
jgi:hypothetical protein